MGVEVAKPATARNSPAQTGVQGTLPARRGARRMSQDGLLMGSLKAIHGLARI